MMTIAPPRRPMIDLRGPDKPPIVRGRRWYAPLPPVEYAAVQALIDLGCLDGRRVSHAELGAASVAPNPVQALHRLRDHGFPVRLPGGRWRGGYGFDFGPRIGRRAEISGRAGDDCNQNRRYAKQTVKTPRLA